MPTSKRPRPAESDRRSDIKVVAVPASVRDRLARLAQANERSLTAECRFALREHARQAEDDVPDA